MSPKRTTKRSNTKIIFKIKKLFSKRNILTLLITILAFILISPLIAYISVNHTIDKFIIGDKKSIPETLTDVIIFNFDDNLNGNLELAKQYVDLGYEVSIVTDSLITPQKDVSIYHANSYKEACNQFAKEGKTEIFVLASKSESKYIHYYCSSENLITCILYTDNENKEAFWEKVSRSYEVFLDANLGIKLGK